MRVIKKWLFGNSVDRDTCIFCKYIPEPGSSFLYEDDKYFVIKDINQASSLEHLLVITKEHIDNALEVKNPQTIHEMHKIGQKVLADICEKQGLDKQFRFGFHFPPFNSVDHLHLHCFIEPLSQWKYDSLHYGWVFNTVEQTLAKLQPKQLKEEQ